MEPKLFPTALNVMGGKIAFLDRTCCSAFCFYSLDSQSKLKAITKTDTG